MSSLGDFSLPGEAGVFVEVFWNKRKDKLSVSLCRSASARILYSWEAWKMSRYWQAYFNTSCDNGEIELQWQTASKINTNYFTIEKSADAFNFLPVTKFPQAKIVLFY